MCVGGGGRGPGVIRRTTDAYALHLEHDSPHFNFKQYTTGSSLKNTAFIYERFPTGFKAVIAGERGGVKKKEKKEEKKKKQ